MADNGRVLCFRIKPEEVPQSMKAKFLQAYGNVVFQYINPATPETMLELVHEKGVVAVYIPQKQPIYTVNKERKIPYISHASDGALVRIKGIMVDVELLPDAKAVTETR